MATAFHCFFSCLKCAYVYCFFLMFFNYRIVWKRILIDDCYGRYQIYYYLNITILYVCQVDFCNLETVWLLQSNPITLNRKTDF